MWIPRAATPLLAAALLLGCADKHLRALPQDREPRAWIGEAAAPVRLALVLSSGSRRGFAHVGALAALERHGIRPDLVVGTSAGALVGALYASGASPASLARSDVGDGFDRLFDLLPGREARSVQLEDFVGSHLRQEVIERFPIRFAAVATGLRDGCVALFNAGDAARAVHASSSVPGFFAPATIRGVAYGDGGMASPLPVRAARALGAQRVIAIDVSFHAGWEPPEDRVDSFFYGALLMVRNLAETEAGDADLVIRPDLPSVERVEAGDFAAVVMAGERAVLEAMPRIRRLLAEPLGAPPARDVRHGPRFCPSTAATLASR